MMSGMEDLQKLELIGMHAGCENGTEENIRCRSKVWPR